MLYRAPYKRSQGIMDRTQHNNMALDIQALSYQFGSAHALEDIHLTVHLGEFTALLGLNGAGKTTLVSLITRLYSSKQGRIKVFGIDIEKNPSKALAQMGVVFQQRTLDLDLTVKQNLQYHLALHGLSTKGSVTKITQALTHFNLQSKLKEKVRNLSGGQIRAVEIARALLHEPKLLLLDEPTVGLDMHNREFIVASLHALVAQNQVGVLYTTHLVDELRPTDTLVILHKGKIVKSGSLESILKESNTQTIKEAFSLLIGERA